MISNRLGALATGGFLLLVGGLTGCGGADQGPGVAHVGSTAASSVSAGDQLQKYADCLSGQGVVLLGTAGGAVQVDKQRTSITVMSKATQACRSLEPAAEAPPRISAADLQTRRQYAACIRQHGVAAYPDPDPQTGESALSDSLATQLKSDPAFAAAMEACRGSEPDSNAVSGG